jgi:hypothetical protein
MNSNDNIEDRNNIFNLEIRDRDRENASLSPVSESERTHRINNETTNVRTSSSSENTEAEVDVDVESGVNNYSNYYYNNNNTRNNHRRRCRECNYLNTPLYRSRNIEIDRDRDRDRNRDRYQYLQHEREQYRDRTMLNQIYNELLHQNNLLQSMRIDISNIWNRIRTNDEYSRSRYQHNRTNTSNNTTNNRQNGSSNPRININGIPYILENIQHFNSFPRTTPNATTSTDFINSFMNMMDFQSNVPIIPTREQIWNATHEIQFDEIENPINATCPISLETFQETDIVTQILYCGHNFNTRQLNTWFQSNVRCPMCRYDIRDYDVPLERAPETPTTEPLDTSNNHVNNHSERRTRFSQRPPFESSINNIATNLSTIAMDTINDLFERNNNNFEENGESRFLFDPSNNILLFETIVNNGNRFRYRNRNSNSDNQNRDPRNIV